MRFCSTNGYWLALLLALPGLVQADWPPSRCDHVDVLDAGDTDEVSWRFDGTVTAIDGTLESPRENQLDTLGEALDMLPEFLCKAVRKVAFVNRPPDRGVLDYLGFGDDTDAVVEGWTTVNDRQNIIYLNTHSLSAWNESSLGFSEEARKQAIHRAVHEATHVAVYLIQSQQKHAPAGFGRERPDPDLWPPDVQQMAKDAIKSNRLNIGVMREWGRIHAAFMALGLAEAYYGGSWPEKDGFSAEALAGAGFMSAYGGEKVSEDIAEFASWAIVGASDPNSGDAACKIMSGRAESGIRSADAAVFTKLGFAHTLGFIPEQQYNACKGRLKIDAPGEGFHTYRDGNHSASYTANPNAGAGSFDDDTRFMFSLEAEGTAGTSSDSNVPVSMLLLLNITPTLDEELTFEDLSYPRGIYHVGFRNSEWNRLQIAKKEDGGLLMDVGQGVALVGLASSEGIVGSVAVQRIFNFSGGALSAIAGDEPVSEPTRVTFRYKPRN